MKIRKSTTVLGKKCVTLLTKDIDFVVFSDEVVVYCGEARVPIPTSILRDILNCDFLEEEGEKDKSGGIVRFLHPLISEHPKT